MKRDYFAIICCFYLYPAFLIKCTPTKTKQITELSIIATLNHDEEMISPDPTPANIPCQLPMKSLYQISILYATTTTTGLLKSNKKHANIGFYSLQILKFKILNLIFTQIHLMLPDNTAWKNSQQNA